MKRVIDEIKEILTQKLGLADSEVTPQAHFMRDLGVDSLDYVELMMEFENAFNIKISEAESAMLKTVEQAAEFIESKLDSQDIKNWAA
ncbi:MAG: acyl carrier protein [Verrucomicrobia bacterium]|nr:acyl carrier protein [Cytophagales bacterium]